MRICSEQNIPCFQMIQEYFSAGCEMRTVAVSKFTDKSNGILGGVEVCTATYL